MAGSLIKEISVNIGMSVDRKGLWVKAGAEVKISVSPEDNLPENRELLFKRAYEIVAEEVDKELERLGVNSD